LSVFYWIWISLSDCLLTYIIIVLFGRHLRLL